MKYVPHEYMNCIKWVLWHTIYSELKLIHSAQVECTRTINLMRLLSSGWFKIATMSSNKKKKRGVRYPTAHSWTQWKVHPATGLFVTVTTWSARNSTDQMTQERERERERKTQVSLEHPLERCNWMWDGEMMSWYLSRDNTCEVCSYLMMTKHMVQVWLSDLKFPLERDNAIY